ncbi:MAG TPA: tetratricopeptide repeat protein [Steroidobacteraceae bacterium]|nr:tetratricopeptide repeat protein [Steroidobacteraceae bacterium]
MHAYGVRDVERILKLSPETIRGLVRAGFVSPGRGPRRSLRFSFRDLIVLRAARALSLANVPSRRITRSLQRLQQELPAEAPLSGLRICAIGEEVVVSAGANRWRAETGQYLLDLEVQVDDGALRVVEHTSMAALPSQAAAQPTPEETAGDCFERGLEAEGRGSLADAQRAYEQAITLEPSCVDACINLGRIFHESGRLAEAERIYREGVAHCGPDATLFYNLGVLLEDAGRVVAAVEAYQQALTSDPDLADCHYNLARLFEAAGKKQHAIRHLGQYRRLTS